MSEALLNLLSAYGLPGLVIFGMGWALYYQTKYHREELKEISKERAEERLLWAQERKTWNETEEKYIETSIEVIQANSKALAELTTFIQYEIRDVKHHT